MKLLKISSISLLVMFSFVFVSPVLAEGTATPATTAAKTIVLATMNIRDAKIISQEGNVLNISFNISNREGAQSGVKYGVKLLQQVDKKQTVIDESIYPEVLSVGENTTITKNIVYNAPVGLDGTYTVMLLAKNYSGLPLGNAKLGEVKFVATAQTVEILPETCFITLSSNKTKTLNLNDGAKVGKTDDVSISCTIKNNNKEEALATPTFATYYRSIYGEEIDQIGGDVSPILLQAGESRVVNLTLPKVTVPQSYVTKVYMKTGEIASNYVLVNYTLSGLSATIQNFSLDKTSYKTNDTAKISFFWTSSATKKDEMSAITINANIVNKNEKACTTPVSQQLASVGFIEIPVSITRSCENPQVVIELKDASGNILDQKALAFEATKKAGQNIFAGQSGIIMIIVFAILVIAALVVAFKKSKRKDISDIDSPSNTGGHIDGSTLAMFFFIFIFGLALIPGGKASADTIYITVDQVETWQGYDYGYGYIILETSLDKSVYNYGEQVTIDSYISYSDYSQCSTVNLETWLDSEMERMDFDGETIVCGGDYLHSNHTFNYGVTSSGTVNITGYVNFYGVYSSLYINWPLYFTVNQPQNASVEVTATNASTSQSSTDQIVVNAGTGVYIKWTTQNAAGKTFLCTFPGGSCGNSTGNVQNYWTGETFYPGATTTYTVTEQ